MQKQHHSQLQKMPQPCLITAADLLVDTFNMQFFIQHFLPYFVCTFCLRKSQTNIEIIFNKNPPKNPNICGRMAEMSHESYVSLRSTYWRHFEALLSKNICLFYNKHTYRKKLYTYKYIYLYIFLYNTYIYIYIKSMFIFTIGFQ